MIDYILLNQGGNMVEKKDLGFMDLIRDRVVITTFSIIIPICGGLTFLAIHFS
jgi:hypothetical protein